MITAFAGARSRHQAQKRPVQAVLMRQFRRTLFMLRGMDRDLIKQRVILTIGAPRGRAARGSPGA